MSADERMGLLDGLVEAGLDAARMMPGTGCCSIADSVTLTRHAVSLGVGGVLMLPPFYYKGVSDEGLYRNFAEIIERVGDDRLRIYLYHFPQMSAVPFSVELVGRLRESFPGVIGGMKDSSGDRDHLERMLKAFPSAFAMFCGSEALFLDNLRLGGAGCISATANVNPAAIVNLYRSWRTDEAEAIQARLQDVRGVVQRFNLVPALKAILAHYRHDPEWNRLRPPLVELSAAEAAELVSALDAAGFESRFPGPH